jgi:ferric-dicitrate binding protein FerR (iron transport regulator)
MPLKDEAYINNLIGKYLAGEAGPEEAMELEEWKSLSPANLEHYDQCLRIFEISSGKPFPKTDEQNAWKKVKAEIGETGKVIPLAQNRWYWRAAAAVAAILVVSVALFYLLQPTGEKNIIYSADTKTEKVRLDDHSQVAIAPHSHIELDKNYGKTNRTVKLTGSAYFEVRHDDKIPFLVDAGKVYIKDIGTKFSIRRSQNNDTLTVQVDEGTVLLYDSSGTQLTLHASQQAQYICSAGKVVERSKAEVHALLHFDFEGTTLGEAIYQLNQGYHTRIQLENPALADCSITTSFTGQDIETVMTVMTETLGLRYEKTADGYLVKGEACNR